MSDDAKSRDNQNHKSWDRITGNHGTSRSTKQLSPSDYNVAWICALSLEMSAAIAMLDEEHLPVETAANDKNIYILGSISGHNVAITCLPDGIYGTTSAALVAENMCSTFPCIKMPLLVGIGGGVPQTGYDIRLGDVVVGIPSSDCPAIVQYDYGKREAEGFVNPKGTLDRPASTLLRAAAVLRARYQLQSNHISSRIAQIIGGSRHAKELFSCPGVEDDILYDYACQHATASSACSSCGSPREIARSKRTDPDPSVFYGTIASGNQVMKHAPTRDQIALGQSKHILCFEMEAAGVIQVLPCLVIRGICDYCDSQKHKQFQGYAALTAAAYAKELLNSIPNHKNIPINVVKHNSGRLEHRRKVLEVLMVESAESHKATIKRAHPATCSWLAQQNEFKQWRDLENIAKHHGLFWLKGKPGTGKSVMMKYLYQQIGDQGEMKTISFFYNARGAQLGKSTSGMYRSLIYQLLNLSTTFQDILDGVPLLDDGEGYGLDLLQGLFQRLLERCGQIDLFCFIDALDECSNEDQVRDMMDIFEDLGEMTASGLLRFRACFSSRHYPNISLRSSMQTILEEQSGHEHDIIGYIDAELGFGKPQQLGIIMHEILRKSSGVFLWVFLVVRVLKREYDRGRVQTKTMLERLADFPPGLQILFHDMLRRGTDNSLELQSCIRWVLYAIQPLKKKELYYAIQTEINPTGIGPWKCEEISEADMTRYLLDCSKGLIEFTNVREPTVQFIHESVREFLLKPDVLSDIWSNFQGFQDFNSWEILKVSCYTYFMAVADESKQLAVKAAEGGNGPSSIRKVVDTICPFLDHSSRYVLQYADNASLSGSSQTRFLQNFDTTRWIYVRNATEKWHAEHYPHNAGLFTALVRLQLEHLLSCLLEILNSSARTWGTTLDILKLAGSDREAISMLSDQSPKLGMENVQVHIDNIRDLQSNASNPEFNTYLHTILYGSESELRETFSSCIVFAIGHGHEGIISLLLARISDASTAFTHSHTSSYTTTERSSGHLTRGISPSTLSGESMSQHRSQAAKKRSDTASKAICDLLLNHEADVAAYCGSTVLHFAIRSFATELVPMLLQRGLNVNSTDISGKTSLHIAAEEGRLDLVRYLSEYGADLNMADPGLKTALHLAIDTGNYATAKLLIEKGAKVDARDIDGNTPLILSVQCFPNQDTCELVESPLDLAADINATNARSEAAFHLTVDSISSPHLLLQEDTKSKESTTQWKRALICALLRRGADPEMRDVDGYNPFLKAVVVGDLEALDTLAERGIGQSQNDLDTTLIFAAIHGHEISARWLIDQGASIHCRDTQGRTPLYHAILNCHFPMAGVLLLKGAVIDATKDYEILMNKRETITGILQFLMSDAREPYDKGRTLCSALILALKHHRRKLLKPILFDNLLGIVVYVWDESGNKQSFHVELRCQLEGTTSREWHVLQDQAVNSQDQISQLTSSISRYIETVLNLLCRSTQLWTGEGFYHAITWTLFYSTEKSIFDRRWIDLIKCSAEASPITQVAIQLKDSNGLSKDKWIYFP